MIHTPDMQTYTICSCCKGQFESYHADIHKRESDKLVKKKQAEYETLIQKYKDMPFTMNLVSDGNTVLSFPVYIVDIECDVTICVSKPHINPLVKFDVEIPTPYDSDSDIEFNWTEYVRWNDIIINGTNITISDYSYALVDINILKEPPQ